MKAIIILSLFLVTCTAFGELTKEDIRTIVKEENDVSEKRMKEYIDLKIDATSARIDATSARIDAAEKSLSARIDAAEKSLNAKIDTTTAGIDGLKENVNRIWLAIIALIAAAVALPQLIIAYTERKRQKDIERGQQDLQTEIQQLRERIEAMENTPSMEHNA